MLRETIAKGPLLPLINLGLLLSVNAVDHLNTPNTIASVSFTFMWMSYTSDISD